MKMSIPFVTVGSAAFAIAGVLLFASGIAAPRPASAAEPVAMFKATVTPAKARVGQVVTVTIVATVEPPYHIYSSVPVPPPGPVATEFTFKAKGLMPLGKIMESTPKRKMDVNFNKMVGIHEKTATFTQKFTVAKTAKVGKLPIIAEAGFMACDATRCLPPKFVPVAPATLTITK